MVNLNDAKEWQRLEKRREEVETRRGIYESSSEVLQKLDPVTDVPKKQYISEPLADTITSTFADYLFSQPTKFSTKNETTTELINSWLKKVGLVESLVDAHHIVSSEGELWYRLAADSEGNPYLQWLTADRILYSENATTRQLDDVCIFDVDHVDDTGGDDAVTYRVTRYSYIDRSQIDGYGYLPPVEDGGGSGELYPVVNIEYWGKTKTHGTEEVYSLIGKEPPQYTLTSTLPIGRVVNRQSLINKDLAENDYTKILDLLLAVNMSLTIGARNVLSSAGNQFMATSQIKDIMGATSGKTFSSMGGNEEHTNIYYGGLSPEAQSVLTDMTIFMVEGGLIDEGNGQPPIKQIDKHFDAANLIEWIKELKHKIVNSVGLVQQSLEDPAGGASSGVAIKLRYLPTQNAAQSRQRNWNKALKHIVMAASEIYATPTTVDNGQGIDWGIRSDEDITIEFGSILPVDTVELINSEAVAVAAEIRSRLQGIRNLNPEWSEEQVQTELELITKEISLTV